MKVKGVLPALVCVVDSRVVNHKMVPETKTLFIFCLFTKQIARPLYSLAFLANCHHNHMFKAVFGLFILYNIKTNFTHYTKFYVHSSRIRVRTLAIQISEWREPRLISRAGQFRALWRKKQAREIRSERTPDHAVVAAEVVSSSSQYKQKQRSALLNVKKGSFTIIDRYSIFSIKGM